MSGFSTFREVKGRKRYQCCLCLLPIRQGAKHIHATGVYDGDFFSDRRHAVCNAATARWDEYDWECSVGADAEFREFDLKLPTDGMITAWHRRQNRAAENSAPVAIDKVSEK